MFGVKYRPLTFSGVYGLPIVKKVLQKVLRSGQFDPGYLFEGSYSSGKTTISRIFARAVLCENRQEDMSPCNKCSSCRAFLENRHTDYMEIDAANNGTKDKIQEIKEAIRFESVTGTKIILFDEAHNISKEGKDAILTQLEKEGTNVIIIFCTTEIEKMPETLRSRCVEFCLPEAKDDDIIDKLQKICETQKLKYDTEALHLILRATGRHYRDAENKLRQISMLGDINKENVQDIINLYDDDIAEMLYNLPDNLSKVVEISDYLISRMNIKSIYSSILRILSDSIKHMNGVTFSSIAYTKSLNALNKKFGAILFELTDYILNRNKLNDVTFFQSDLLILHYKFVKGGLKFKPFEPLKSESQPVKKERPKTASRGIIDDPNLEPWEKEEKLRELKASRIANKREETVSERVTKQWGPEKVEIKADSKSTDVKMTPDDVSKIMVGDSGTNKI